MSELKNFPFKNQLNEPDLDPGIPDQNADMNCVPTCIAAGMQYLTGKPYTGEILEHAVYGSGYHGGTAAVAYVDYCAVRGVKLWSIYSSDSNYLVKQAHAHLALGHPVLCTLKADYTIPTNRDDPGLSHVVVFYKDAPGSLTAMNPWNAFSQQNTDAWWSARLCFESIWIMEKLMNTIPKGWKDDGKTLTAPNGKRMVLGFRSAVLSAEDWDPGNIPLEEEHHVDYVQLHSKSYGPGQAQLMRDGQFWYTEAKGVIYEHQLGAEIYARDQLIAALQAQIAEQKSVDPSIKQNILTYAASIQGEAQKL